MSLSDVSDLTDLSSEEDVPLAKSTNRTRRGPKEYKISHVLRAPRTTQYTAKSLYDQIIDNAIDLDPEYQRDVVWNEEKQSGLIDSILRNYYIPPIIFAVSFQDDGSELRTCIDGKQRLTSVQRFLDGQVHKDSFTNEKLWFKPNITSPRRKLLPQYLRTQFLNKQVVCVEYTDLNDDQEREIFQRVQLGVALTPAERLQAIVGPWSTIIREIQSQVLGEEGFEGYLDWGHARGRDFQCLATIGYLIENHPKHTVPGTKTLEKWLLKSNPIPPKLRADLHETFRIFVVLAREKKYSVSLNRPTRVSPIEFVMIGVLIYLKRTTLSLTQLSSAIEKLRKDVRADHKDIRSNTRVTKHIVDFITKRLKVPDLASDNEGNIPASIATKPTKTVKRKRHTFSDSDNEAEEPSARNTKTGSTGSTSKAASMSSGTKLVSPVESTPASKSTGKPTTTLAQRPSSSLPGGSRKPGSIPPPPKPPAVLPAAPSSTSRSVALERPPSESGLPPSVTATAMQASSRPLRPSDPSSTPAAQPPHQTPRQITPLVKTEPSDPPLPLSSASAFDRLAPIRAAKASLFSNAGTVQSTVLTNEPSGRGLSTLADTQQTPEPSQQPLVGSPSSSTSPSSAATLPQTQTLSINPLQLGEMLRTHGLLQNLQNQINQIQMAIPTHNQGTFNGVLTGQNNPAMQDSPVPVSVPGFVNSAYSDTPPQLTLAQRISVETSHLGGSQPVPPHGPHQTRMHTASQPAPASVLSFGGQTREQRPLVASSTTTIGSRTLPQRPTSVAAPPRTSMRAEALGQPPQLASSAGSEDRRSSSQASFAYDRRRSYDDRRRDIYDHGKDRDRRDLAWRERHRDAGWGGRGRGGGMG
ncbi:hypothetical protein F5I97DRAFT_1050037 [Phlebopus sp. FC_14]|nr:hypothetical protein F5I97DRAFT_1050037 [Phlebopus sp. FC_14]